MVVTSSVIALLPLVDFSENLCCIEQFSQIIICDMQEIFILFLKHILCIIV